MSGAIISGFILCLTVPEPVSRDRGLLLVALGSTLWGTDTVLRQPLAREMASAHIVFYEHVALIAVVIPVLLATRGELRRLRWKDWAALAGIAWGGSALATYCFTEAVRLGNPTSAALLQKLQPLFTVFLAAGFLDEKLSRRHWGYFFAALAGALLVTIGGPAGFRHDLLAAAPALAAAALWGSSTVLGRYVAARVSFLATTALRILLALPLLAALAFAPAGAVRWPSVAQGLSLIWLALLPGFAALLLYYRGLRGTPAPLAAIAELCFPATTVALNWLFLEVQPTLAQGAGFAAIWWVVARLSLVRPPLPVVESRRAP
jgi:drug/metabolite transporter (DMT)-like permease